MFELEKRKSTTIALIFILQSLENCANEFEF